jgi:hypothetical protein
MNSWNSRAAHIVALVVSVAAVNSFSQTNAGLVINDTLAGGAPPPNLVGGGNLTTILETAVSDWEAAYPGPDNWTVNLQFEWANLGGVPNARFVPGPFGGKPLRIESGVIQFNNSGLTRADVESSVTGNCSQPWKA